MTLVAHDATALVIGGSVAFTPQAPIARLEHRALEGAVVTRPVLLIAHDGTVLVAYGETESGVNFIGRPEVSDLAVLEGFGGYTPDVDGLLESASDPEGRPLSWEVVTEPANGVLVPWVGGGFSYTPDAGFTGTDTFDYRVWGGGEPSNIATVSIEVIGDFIGAGITARIHLVAPMPGVDLTRSLVGKVPKARLEVRSEAGVFITYELPVTHVYNVRLARHEYHVSIRRN